VAAALGGTAKADHRTGQSTWAEKLRSIEFFMEKIGDLFGHYSFTMQCEFSDSSTEKDDREGEEH
jgi:hypothetical protein